MHVPLATESLLDFSRDLTYLIACGQGYDSSTCWQPPTYELHLSVREVESDCLKDDMVALP